MLHHAHASTQSTPYIVLSEFRAGTVVYRWGDARAVSVLLNGEHNGLVSEARDAVLPPYYTPEGPDDKTLVFESRYEIEKDLSILSVL